MSRTPASERSQFMEHPINEVQCDGPSSHSPVLHWRWTLDKAAEEIKITLGIFLKCHDETSERQQNDQCTFIASQRIE